MKTRMLLASAPMAVVMAIGTLGLAAPAQADSIYLDFEGIAPYPNNSNVSINGYYNGGTSSIGTSGPNLGVEFINGATLLCLNTGGTVCSNTSRGGLGIPTSAFAALYFPNTNPIMNVAAGFDTGFSFVYSDPFSAGSIVNIYSGLNATGTLLASAVLPNTPDAGCDFNISGGAHYCPFLPYSVAFAGVAMSVQFGGAVNSQVFDDFTFGSVIVGGGVPEPASWAMMIAGFGLAGAGMRRRKMAKAVHFA